MEHRVVITGMGLWSCLGQSLQEVEAALRAGRSGIGFAQGRKDMGYRSALTGVVPTPDLKGRLTRRERIGMAEQANYAFAATEQALAQAGIDRAWLEANETGIIFGNDSSALAVMESVDTIRKKNDTTLVGSGAIFQGMNCTVTMNLSTILKLKGINFTLSGACASGSHAIGIGYLLIKQGLQRMVICGGAQEVNDYAFGSFDGISAFSTKEDDPAGASRPFDANRDGLVPSGGAAALIIESLESARQRGAAILGEITGYGFSSNGDHISDPNLDGQVRALRMALGMAGISAADIDYVNAHATGTPVGDRIEAQAIDAVFGQRRPYVSSTKSMTGHECWMAGASEVVYSMLMMLGGFIAPNVNLRQPDEDSSKLNLVRETIEAPINRFLSNSFGFGGTNSTLIVQRYQD
ncbi:MAG: beta-ketoacyl-[acyl-carrier-protein] synthase family protein [Flavobacteriales bacterium]|jgi:3-oxoacyl-[acyl-carrier-protein] synthase-1|nr:beta-ketoacyl-[acyl-carrier-protein] synthase family protein [Flavobacteriales bacterium]